MAEDHGTADLCAIKPSEFYFSETFASLSLRLVKISSRQFGARSIVLSDL